MVEVTLFLEDLNSTYFLLKVLDTFNSKTVDDMATDSGGGEYIVNLIVLRELR